MDHIQLEHCPDCRTAILREITGIEEQQVSGTTTVDTMQLLEHLLVEIPGFLPRDNLVKLTASDRDRLLAAVYRRTYGNRIASSVVCVTCGDVFDLHFNLLMLDVHVLAVAYGWSLNEIMGLPRSQRTSLVAMVEMGETLKQVD